MRNHTRKIERPVASLQECMMASQTFAAEQGLAEPGAKIRIICKTQ